MNENHTVNVIGERKKHGHKKRKLTLRQIKIRKIIYRLIIAAFALYFVIIMVNQQIKINKKNEEIEALYEQITEASSESERLKAEVDNLNNPEYIEKIAREKLGLVRPNERVFVDSNKSEDNNVNK